MMSARDKGEQPLSRRALLKSMGLAPLVLRPAPFWGSALFAPPDAFADPARHFAFSDIRLTPHYPVRSPLADVLALTAPGSDDYVTEKYAVEMEALLGSWSKQLRAAAHGADARPMSALSAMLDAAIEASSLAPVRVVPRRSGFGLEVEERHFDPKLLPGRDDFLASLKIWLGEASRVATAEFQVIGIQVAEGQPGKVIARMDIRYDLVTVRRDVGESIQEERVGTWQTEWLRDTAGDWKARRWVSSMEVLSRVRGSAFVDVTAQALGGVASYREQMLFGVDHWRTVLDGACGLDVYGNNGVSAGDYDNDGFDDFYVCQPAGLPNRLYRNLGNGTLEDVTDKAGVGVLDNTACALFADFANRGLQDLLVVCAGGPLLFTNKGDGTFAHKPDAFKFTKPPQGSFTHAAVADYDRDGRLDIYFCMYSYYLGLDQYHYPVPYFDARNGPPNSLLHNEGDGTFVEKTEAAGLNVDNDRYTFACAWGDANGNGLPDLCVVNDFGRPQLYRNNGNGTFTVTSEESHVDDPAAGMSACWADFNNDGQQDIYTAGMWEAAGQRVAAQSRFQPGASPGIRALYQRHARGNALYRNNGHGSFSNIAEQASSAMGRWAWSADAWDFDHDGYADIYVTNGYVSALARDDLASFFWRQVVDKSPNDATPSPAYERGWNAINELIRSDQSWSGRQRNVAFANNRDGSFAEASGILGLDFLEDSRAFSLADIDHDGRLEVLVKNRNAPQLRVLHNNIEGIGHSIAFRLRGHTSNRDALGSAVTVETGTLRQTKYLQAGTGFLSQHSKELFFGVGHQEGLARATVRWPNGLVQQFDGIPLGHRISLEEGVAHFKAMPFGVPAAVYEQTAPPLKQETPSAGIETWLIQPVKAPGFSLPDLTGKFWDLAQLKGNPVLLIFWATTAPRSMEQLTLISEHYANFQAMHFQGIAVNVDGADTLPRARSMASKAGFPFPVLFANELIAGTYSIIYRYLFDRRRDLGIPTSFLLDGKGMVVKLYQDVFDAKHFLADSRIIPEESAARRNLALPFKGTAYQASFERNDFTYGVAFYQHGYLDQAEEAFQQVIAAKPNDAEGYYNLGTLNLQQHRYDQAQQYLEKTLSLRPDYPEAWNNLGMIAGQQGRADEAIRNFQQALSQRPAYATALLNLGNTYRRKNAFVEARQALDKALSLEPGNAEVNYSIGMLYAQQDDQVQAAGYLTKAIELRPEYPEALNNLGILFVHERNYPNAEAQFETCIRLSPQFDQSYLNLARVYAMENNVEEAKNVLQRLLNLQPDNAGARKALESLR